jgi:hypothetical protein
MKPKHQQSKMFLNFSQNQLLPSPESFQLMMGKNYQLKKLTRFQSSNQIIRPN